MRMPITYKGAAGMLDIRTGYDVKFGYYVNPSRIKTELFRIPLFVKIEDVSGYVVVLSHQIGHNPKL